MKFRLLIFIFSLGIGIIGHAQRSITEHPEFSGVYRAIENYVDALYEVDSSKIITSIHPEMRKRGYWYDGDKNVYRDNLDMTFTQLKKLASSWNANGTRADSSSPKKIDIYDINDRTATGKLSAAWGIDYFHLAKLEGTWYIMNVLWQSYPPDKAK